MGQYQQWLSAQEVDRRLKAEIETLETELFYLQDRITILEQVVPATESVILCALVEYLRTPGPEEYLRPSSSQEQRIEEPTHQVVASHIREAQPVAAPQPELVASQGPAEEAGPYLPRTFMRSEMSEDMLAFFDRRSQTDPKVSAMLQRERQRAQSSGQDIHLIDEETRRLNENIERWFVRWHRETPLEEEEHEQ